MSDYQYRVIHKEEGKPDIEIGKHTDNPKEAGETFKQHKNQLEPGNSSSLQRRPYGKWEDIEVTKK